MTALSSTIPSPTQQLIDPATGHVTMPWWYVFQRLLARTGGSIGVDALAVEAAANAATAAAATATTAATAASAAAAAASAAVVAETAARGAAITAEAAARNAAVAAEATARAAADALLATKANPVFTGAEPKFALFGTYASDAAAATGGIVVGQLYWDGTAVVQRRV